MTALPAGFSQSRELRNIQYSQSAQVNLPIADIRRLLEQIEADFCRSQLYQTANQWLQQQLPEQEDVVSRLFRTLSQEAVRLAVTHLSIHGVMAGDRYGEPSAAPKAEAVAELPNPFAPLTDELDALPSAPAPVASAARTEPQNPTAFSKADPSQTTTLADVGHLLQKARQQKGLTVDQLHQSTHVPRPHIRAIEAGESDRLPEIIYVRGFVRQMGKALGLDSAQLLNSAALSTPTPPAAQRHKLAFPDAPLPAARRGSPTPRRGSRATVAPTPHHLRPAHLYTGYATLMAGAVGSLCWVTWQPMLNQPLSDQLILKRADPLDSPSISRTNSTSGLNTSSPRNARGGESGVPAKLRHFQFSKQPARRLGEASAIALPELILTPLQTLQTLELRTVESP